MASASTAIPAARLRRELGACALTLLALGTVVLGPYVVSGGFYFDDWENAATTRYAYQSGFLGPIDLRTLAYQPLLALLIPLTHGLLGTDPAPHLALALLLAV